MLKKENCSKIFKNCFRVFKKYSKVPFDYGTERSDYGMAEAEVEEEEEVRDGRGRVIYGPDDKIEEGKGKENDKDGSGQESDPVRFAFHQLLSQLNILVINFSLI